jgi:hypothetical protein
MSKSNIPEGWLQLPLDFPQPPFFPLENPAAKAVMPPTRGGVAITLGYKPEDREDFPPDGKSAAVGKDW